MKKIVPHLWFDTEAKQAADFYTSIFPRSEITHSATLHDTPSGDADMVSFSIDGVSFMAISAGPVFKINPSISFFLNFDPSKDPSAREHLDALWAKLSEDGQVLMPLQEYPFSKHYGWVQDRFGVSWQLILTNPTGEERPFIVPSLLFTQSAYGKAQEAINFYVSTFKDSRIGSLHTYPEDMGPNKKDTVMFADFQLNGAWFAAMDGGGNHAFSFNEAISFIVQCETQEEIDYYWEKLSAAPESEQCGWLKDKYGVSWQIVPTLMNEMMASGTQEQIARVTQAFLKMKKFDIAELQKAYNG